MGAVIEPALRAEVEAWIADDPDPITAAALARMLAEGDLAGLKRSFNGLLEFGTAGLRGAMDLVPHR